MKKSLFKLKVLCVALLKQGTSPTKLSAAVAVSAILSLFPVLGITSLLCLLAAKLLKLNPILVQTVNFFVYPLQLLLLLPLIQMGRYISGLEPLEMEASTFVQQFKAAPWDFFMHLAWQQMYGVIAWAIIALPLAWLFYFSALKLLPRLFVFAPLNPLP